MMNLASNESSVDSALEVFMSKDLGSWKGLNPGTNLEDISRFFNVDETWTGTSTLGDVNRPFVWYLGKSDKFREDVRIWMGKHRAFLLGMRNPGIAQTIDDLVLCMGSPRLN